MITYKFIYKISCIYLYYDNDMHNTISIKELKYLL